MRMDYYVYKYVVGGEVWYVGAGCRSRDTHHLALARLSEKDPGNYNVRPWHVELQKAAATGKKIEIVRVREKLTSAEAKTLELRTIAKLKPLKNQHNVLGLATQGTRMLKLECSGCGYVARTTRKWLEVGAPSCCCGAGPLSVVDDSSARPPRDLGARPRQPKNATTLRIA
jgi:hypothetical protein